MFQIFCIIEPEVELVVINRQTVTDRQLIIADNVKVIHDYTDCLDSVLCLVSMFNPI